jgi:hypothetical protein
MVVNCASQHSLYSDRDCTLTSSSRSCANCRDSQPSAASSPAAPAIAERVICGWNCSLSVRALQLDQVRTQSLVAQQCARHASESMRCHFAAGVTRCLSRAMRGVDDVCRFDLFVGEGNERVDYSVMLSAAFDTGVNTVRHMPTRFRAFLPRRFNDTSGYAPDMSRFSKPPCPRRTHIATPAPHRLIQVRANRRYNHWNDRQIELFSCQVLECEAPHNGRPFGAAESRGIEAGATALAPAKVPLLWKLKPRLSGRLVLDPGRGG